MNCNDINEQLLIDLLYDELDDTSQSTLRTHLKSCADCAARYESIQQTTEALNAFEPINTPCDSRTLAALADAIMRLNGSVEAPKQNRWRAPLIGMAAGLILFVSLLAMSVDANYTDGRLSIAFGSASVDDKATLPDTTLIRNIVHDEVDSAATVLFGAMRGLVGERTHEQEQQRVHLVQELNKMRETDLIRFERLEAAQREAHYQSIETHDKITNMTDALNGVIQLVAYETYRPHNNQRINQQEILP